MIGFLLKKNFFDTWDNFFKIAIINMGFLASAAFPVFVPGLLVSVPALDLLALLVGFLWCFVYLSAAALSLRRVSDYGNFGFADFLENLKAAWPAGLVLGAIVFALYMLSTIAIPFYLGMKSAIGLLFAAFIFWTMVMAVLALQFFFALRARLESRMIKAIKKCFLVFFDNPAFCVFSLFHNLFLLAICMFPVFLFVPGPAGMLLFLDEGLRLRLLKYDWLESNPVPENRKAVIRKVPPQKIPWDAILIDEREKTGSRSLKNFIFPWKD